MSEIGHIVHDVGTVVLCLLSALEGICVGMIIQDFRHMKRSKENQEEVGSDGKKNNHS